MTDLSLSQHCTHCHQPLAADDRFCPRCGQATTANADPDATLLAPGLADALGAAHRAQMIHLDIKPWRSSTW